MAADVAPSLCGCGCGSVTNERQIEARRLRSEGMANVDIAEMWGVDPATVKAYLSRKPSRFVKGHVVYASMRDGLREWTCERCGGVGLSSADAPPRYCQRTDCLAKHNVWRAAIARQVNARRSEQQGRLRSFFADRTPEGRARLRRQALARLRALEAHRGKVGAEREAWLASQPPDVREFVEATERRNFRDRRLDAPRFDGTRTLHDVIPSHEGRVGVEWVDPTGEVIANLYEASSGHEVQPADPRYETLARLAPVIPARHAQRAASAEIVLVVDDDGPRFLEVVPGARVDPVPWRDFAGPIPSMAIHSAGKMRSHGKRKQKQKLARGSHGRGDRKSKSTA
jgi:hypothetical protein